MGLIGSIGSLVGGDQNKKIAKVVMAELKPDGTVSTPVVQFQYYPESISDSRGVSLQEKDVVGGSHPIYQWVHGSPREISFDALFTADLAKDPTNLLQGLSNIVGSVKSPAQALTGAAMGVLNSQKASPWDQDIRSQIAWLRAKTYPLYEGKKPVQAPPKLLLHFPNSGITSFVSKTWTTDVVTCIMTQCNVNYEAFFRNGMPRIATVSLSFTEIIQVGNNWQFVSRSDFDKYWQASKNLPKGDPPSSPKTSTTVSSGILPSR